MSSKKKTAYCDPRFIPGPNEISKSRIKKNLKQIKITDELEVKDFLSSMAAHVARTEGCATFYVKEIFKKKYEQLLEQNPEARDIVQQTTKRKRTHTASSAARKKPCCRNCGLLMEGHNRDRCSSIADPPLQLKTSDLLSMPPSPPPQHSPRSYSSEIIEISDTETTTPIASSLKSKALVCASASASVLGSKSRSSSSGPPSPSFISKPLALTPTQRRHPKIGIPPTPNSTPPHIQSRSCKRTSSDMATASHHPVIISDSDSEMDIPATPLKRRRTGTWTGSTGIGGSSASAIPSASYSVPNYKRVKYNDYDAEGVIDLT